MIGRTYEIVDRRTGNTVFSSRRESDARWIYSQWADYQENCVLVEFNWRGHARRVIAE